MWLRAFISQFSKWNESNELKPVIPVSLFAFSTATLNNSVDFDGDNHLWLGTSRLLINLLDAFGTHQKSYWRFVLICRADHDLPIDQSYFGPASGLYILSFGLIGLIPVPPPL